MKKSYLVIIALVGIAITGTAVMIYLNSSQPTCIEGRLPNGMCDSGKVIDTGRLIEIDGLKAIYDWKDPIEFILRAHGFDGCEQIHIQVYDESKNQTKPAIYDDIIQINDCKNSPISHLKEYSFPVKINPLNVPQGKYFLLITHAHTRTDILVTEQNFEITYQHIINGEYSGIDTEIGQIQIGNRWYFIATLNQSMTTGQWEGKKVELGDAVFTLFPRPSSMNLSGTCMGTFGTSIKFPDNTHERLSIGMPDFSCAQNYTKTILTNHTDPQAGIIVTKGKVKLLSSTQPRVITPPIETDCSQVSELKTMVWHCPVITTPTSFTILETTGLGLCEINHNTYNILPAGQDGSITYQIHRGLDLNNSPQAPDKVEIIQKPDFQCEYNNDTRKSCTPNGVHVNYDPKSIILGFNQTGIVKAIITSDASAPTQTFWLGLTPYACYGGSYQGFTITKSDNQNSTYSREITVLSISPENVTLSEPKKQTQKMYKMPSGYVIPE